jgi:hypothetical protein
MLGIVIPTNVVRTNHCNNSRAVVKAVAHSLMLEAAFRLILGFAYHALRPMP